MNDTIIRPTRILTLYLSCGRILLTSSSVKLFEEIGVRNEGEDTSPSGEARSRTAPQANHRGDAGRCSRRIIQKESSPTEREPTVALGQ